MKVKKKKLVGNVAPFAPLKIKLVIETKEELLNLYHRLDLSPHTVRQQATLSDKGDLSRDVNTTDEPLFLLLSKHASDHGINPYDD